MSTTTLERRVEQLDREIKDRQAEDRGRRQRAAFRPAAERADTTTDTIAALAAGQETS